MGKPESNQTDTITASLDHLLHTPLRRISADRARLVESRVVDSGSGSVTVSGAFQSSI
jgi:hypothetical protein